MKFVITLCMLLPLLTGCATMERLDSIRPSAEKLDTLESAAMAPADGSLLSKEEVRQIALDHTGLNLGQVSRMEITYDYEDGRHIWEVEFRQGSREHHLEIDAVTGQVLEWDVESENG